jgi:hypothetical protein
MPWFPTSLLPSKKINWEAIDDRSAAASIKDGKFKAKVTFNFNNTGEITSVTSRDRSRFYRGKYYEEKWTGYFRRYKEVNDIRIPTEIEAEWNLKSGDFKYLRASVEKIEYT